MEKINKKGMDMINQKLKDHINAPRVYARPLSQNMLPPAKAGIDKNLSLNLRSYLGLKYSDR